MAQAKVTMERRGSPRFSVKVPVHFRIETDEKVLKGIEDWRKVEINLHTLDLSLGGMQIAVDKPLAVGDVLQFEVPLLNKAHKLGVYAKVIRASKTSAGLQFIKLEDGDKEALKAFFEFLKFHKMQSK